MFFESWESMGRTALSAVLSYATVVVFLRLSGKRTLAKMNAFDLVVTVALGSTLAAVITSRDLALADGIVGIGLLIAMQYAVAWLTVRSRSFEKIVKSQPAAVLRNGQMLHEAMRRERLSRDEILAAVRNAGVRDVDRVALVVLETDGSLDVLTVTEEEPSAPSAADVTDAERG